MLQASAAELRVALKERGALEVDGCWRVMSGALLGDTLEVLLLTATQHGWGNCIPVAEAGQAMTADGFDPRQEEPPACPVGNRHQRMPERMMCIVSAHAQMMALGWNIAVSCAVGRLLDYPLTACRLTAHCARLHSQPECATDGIVTLDERKVPSHLMCLTCLPIPGLLQHILIS